jgi:Fe-S-cluster containining protein
MAGADHDPPLLDIPHPRFKMVDPTIFTKTLVADCMSHRCRERAPDRERLDACCQYGADIDLGERDRVLEHSAELQRILRPAAAAAPWFTTEVEVDPDFPSGRHVRTARHGDGCVFLDHDGRGCAIHRASIEGGWDFRGTKPHVCRLFPLTYDVAAIMLSDDYPDYSCAFDPDAPTVYRVQRDTLADVFGPELVAALDAAEQAVLAAQPKRLPVV